MNFLKKKVYNYRESLELCEVLQKDNRNIPVLVLLENPPRGRFYFGTTQDVTALSLKPVELNGKCENIIVDSQTLSFIKALCITRLRLSG